jgi:hypothetical protein
MRCVSIRLSKTDHGWKYRALAKLFRQLIGEEYFDSLARQVRKATIFVHARL